MMEADKAGPTHNSLALITSVETTPITLAALAGQRYNFTESD
jgi:hypothetical protein